MTLSPRCQQVLGAAPQLSDEGRAAYEESLRALRAHVAQHGAHHGAQVAWDTIEERAAQLLEQVKDVRIACYFVLALVHGQPVAQSAQAMGCLALLIEKHHAQLEPPPARERARITSVTWLHEELKNVWAALPAQPEAWHVQTKEAGVHLDRALQAYWPQPMPSFASLVAAVPQRAAARAQAEPTEPPAAGQSGPQRPQVPNPQAPQPTTQLQPLEPMPAFGQSLLVQADAHLQKMPLHPGALRLRRQGLWFHIQAAPVPLGEVTRVAPVPAAMLAKLESLFARQAWAEAHHLAESLMVQHRLVLTLQRLSAEACQALAPEHARAARAIAGETLGLVGRIPELLDARAHDGSPLCDAATQAWLLQAAPQGLASSAPPQAPTPLPPNAETPPPAPSARPDGPRGRFLESMAQAEALDAQGDAALAQAALCALGRGVGALKLAAWEPELVARLCHLELTALGKLPGTERLGARRARVLRRLATVDLNLARQWNQSPPTPRSPS